jgi:hypothetical protein
MLWKHFALLKRGGFGTMKTVMDGIKFSLLELGA